MKIKQLINKIMLCLLLVSFGQLAYAQQSMRVTGTVTDEDGEPLIGVSIKADNAAKSATTTDIDGNYTITLSAPCTLSFEYVGMNPEKVKVKSAGTYNVKLTSSHTALDDVVVVGFGKQKKINLTGAVQSISGSELTNRGVSNVSTALQGVVPGLLAVQSSGQPGADAASISIRGLGSLNSSSSPLVLIDGVEGDMNRIDMSTVESVSVLKDAASAAIYGNRASNGVILITTKRGASSQVKVNYHGFAGVSKPTNLPKSVDAITYMQQMNKAYINNDQTPIYELDEFGMPAEDYTYYDVDWRNLILKNQAWQTSQSVSINGGTDAVRVFANAGYYWQEGLIDNNSFRRTNLRLNTDLNIRPWLKASIDMHYRESTAIRPTHQEAATIIGTALTMNPLQGALNPNGTYAPGKNSFGNPLAMIQDGGQRKDNAPELTLQGTLEANPLPGLDIIVSYNRRDARSTANVHSNNYDVYEQDRYMTTYPSTVSKGSHTEERAKVLNQQFSAQVSYERTIKKHFFKVLGVVQTQKYLNEYLSASRSNFFYDGFNDLMHGDVTTAGNSQSKSELAQIGYIYRVNYSYDDRYLLETSGRYDGTSRFAKGHRWGFFPSVSAGWRVSQEKFFQELNTPINNFKIRASYGEMGNQSISGYYPYTSPVNNNGGASYYFFDHVMHSGLIQQIMANELISWEKSRQWDVGVDLNMFNSRLSVTADYYVRSISDMLQQFPVPAYFQMTAPWENAGSMRNKGWELSLGWNDRVGDVRYSATFVLSDVRNKVTNLFGNEYKGTSAYNSTLIAEGLSLGSYYGFIAEGYWQSQEEIDNYAIEHANDINDNGKAAFYGGDKDLIKPGYIRYRDINGDGLINNEDRVVIGNSRPRYEYSLNLTADWKGFDVAVLFQGIGKRDIFYSGAGMRPLIMNATIYESQLDTWTPENTNAEFPLLLVDNGSTNPNNIMSTFWLKSGAYLRLKNVTIGYTLPRALTRKAQIERVRFYINGNNLLTRSNGYKGFDPEGGAGTSVYPLNRTFFFGVNLDF